jgi:hypothetical protein
MIAKGGKGDQLRIVRYNGISPASNAPSNARSPAIKPQLLTKDMENITAPQQRAIELNHKDAPTLRII